MSLSNVETLLPLLRDLSESWKAFDLAGQKNQIEETLASGKEAREQSLAARKHLAEATKQFKKKIKDLQQAVSALEQESTAESIAGVVKANDAVSKECRGIVNSYKDEIDNLTRRCKSSETVYSSLAQALLQLVDPVDALNACSEQLNIQQGQISQLLVTVSNVNKELDKLEKAHQNEVAASHQNAVGSTLSKKEHEELIELRREVAEYEVEFRSLKNQDITIRKLEARIVELQSAGQIQLQEALEKAKHELAETEGRKAAEALEREAAMERRVQTLELQLKAERAGKEATQHHLLEADEGVSRREAAWEAQRHILIADSERLREELQVAARERDELRLKVAALQDKTSNRLAPQSGGISLQDLMLERTAYEAEVAELTETANLLREELRMKEDEFTEDNRSKQAKIDTLEREKASLQNNLSSLEQQLASAPSQSSVDKMKRELRILKRLEYNADYVDKDPEIAGSNEDDDKDLEFVLVSKLRRAEADLVTERVQRMELVKECETLRESLVKAEKATEEAEKLIVCLEKDLSKAISSPVPKATVARSSSVPKLPGENPGVLESVLDPDCPPPPAPVSSPNASSSAAEKAEDDHSVATIIMAQRDRLRARCEALEAERDSFKRELQAQVSASESLKADNTKLYEKVRYLQNFSSNAAANRGAYARSLSGAERDLDLEALEQRYEASVDPFRQFSKAERQRKLNEMSPMERTVFVVAKTVLATKEMRTALFFYVVILHLLVFVTTYHWSHADSCSTIDYDNLAHLPPNAVKHIRQDFQAMAKEAGN